MPLHSLLHAALPLLLLLLPARASPPLPTKLPPHSWDTVGQKTFIHGCKAEGLLSAEELALVSRFPLLTVEKGQGEALPGYAEDKMAALSRQYRAARPDGWSLFYLNLKLDWNMYRMHETMLANPSFWLRNASDPDGGPCRFSGDPTFPQPADGMLVFNTSSESMREMFVGVCKNATTDAGGGFSGCFIDSAATWRGQHAVKMGAECGLDAAEIEMLNKGSERLLSELQAAVTSGRLIVAKDAGGDYSDTAWANTLFLSDTFCSCYSCVWSTTQAAVCEQQIAAAIAAGKRGQVVLMHGEVNKHPNASLAEDYAFTLSAFLIAAEDSSFFGFSRGWYYNGTAWYVEYDKELGKPLADAEQKQDGVYVRRFARAVVTLEVATHRGTVDWQSAEVKA
eukprot:CAMPEP_0195526388 /NCGR_PEP_ID=MMETSP0794_2-20130614/27428_1 /TAXON_ID=515487 /ORGANISM="Stephanopyxis turris, Strain CCMP 815" /LENGTH=394 /DNA_ID=CAMNT_0040657061 /DNA_START=201 /DNA_END=1381 /DNA_ORIENTATION=-